MEQTLAFAGAILGYIILFFAAQAIWFRLVRVKQLILTFSALAFGSGFIVWSLFYFSTEALYPDSVFRALLSFGGLYGSLGFSGTYIILGPISADRSLSAHICIQTLRMGGQVNKDDLMRKYIANVFDKRFTEYVEVGVMTKTSENYELTSKGKRVAHIFLTFLKALKMKENF